MTKEFQELLDTAAAEQLGFPKFNTVLQLYRKGNLSEDAINNIITAAAERYKEQRMELETLFLEHQTFAKEAFKNSTWASSLRGLEREIKEVEVESKTGWENWVTEYVDCMMYLLDSMQRAGVEMEEFKKLFARKMTINKERNWERNTDGSYSHK